MSKRCGWVTEDQIYLDYHDKEWGRPLYNDQKLFALLCLEGTQAGLSWLTVLKKREAYMVAFDGFDPEIISQYDDEKIRNLLTDKTIIRNELKIKAVVTNAQAYLRIKEDGMTFADYLWSFVDGRPVQNSWHSLSEVPAQTEQSRSMARQLKKDGFKFVGPTICYAFMQSSGMVNDHVTECFCYDEIREGDELDE